MWLPSISAPAASRPQYSDNDERIVRSDRAIPYSYRRCGVESRKGGGGAIGGARGRDCSRRRRGSDRDRAHWPDLQDLSC